MITQASPQLHHVTADDQRGPDPGRRLSLAGGVEARRVHGTGERRLDDALPSSSQGKRGPALQLDTGLTASQQRDAHRLASLVHDPPAHRVGDPLGGFALADDRISGKVLGLQASHRLSLAIHHRLQKLALLLPAKDVDRHAGGGRVALVVLHLLKLALEGGVPIVPLEKPPGDVQLADGRNIVLHLDVGIRDPEEADFFVERYRFEIARPGLDRHAAVAIFRGPVHHLGQHTAGQAALLVGRVDVEQLHVAGALAARLFPERAIADDAAIGSVLHDEAHQRGFFIHPIPHALLGHGNPFVERARPLVVAFIPHDGQASVVVTGVGTNGIVRHGWFSFATARRRPAACVPGAPPDPRTHRSTCSHAPFRIPPSPPYR